VLRGNLSSLWVWAPTPPSVAQASGEMRGLRGRVMGVERECAKSTPPCARDFLSAPLAMESPARRARARPRRS
jgi:hypothetical protein